MIHARAEKASPEAPKSCWKSRAGERHRDSYSSYLPRNDQAVHSVTVGHYDVWLGYRIGEQQSLILSGYIQELL